ncbi:MAG: DUF2332 domain-containing protein [Acidimicrobiia bacterium]
MSDALRLQAIGCERLGSRLYARLLHEMLRDHDAGGVTANLLDGRSDRPVHDAIPLRLLGAVHRIVLRGDAPGLAALYPSAGGTDDGRPLLPLFLAVVDEHSDEVERGMALGVQTNEVGRAAVLVGGFALLARRFGLPLDLLEIGGSAGLLLRWDAYRYETPTAALGDPASPVRFDDVWVTPPPLSETVVRERRACDAAPLDATDPDARLTLLSFVWPDQHARFTRLHDALELAAERPVVIDRADAGDWLGIHLPVRQAGATTVVYHSIVWQYLSRETKAAVRAALAEAGADASPSSPLAWLRMEPAGPVADLRLTTWPSGSEELLATASYHGADVDWLAGS